MGSMKVRTGFDPTDFGSTTVFSKQLDLAFDGTAYFDVLTEVGIDIGDATFDVVGGTVDDVWTLTAHGLLTGDHVQFDAVGTGAEGFLVDTSYYAIQQASANEFQLASTLANAIAGTQIEGTSANSTGTWSLTVQSPAYFGYTATGNTVIEKMIVMIEDGTGMQSVDYGNLSALTNGIIVEVVDSADAVIVALTDRLTVTNNAMWEALTGNAVLQDWSSGNQLLTAVWEFPYPILLQRGEKIRIVAQDDFDALVHQYFTIVGYEL